MLTIEALNGFGANTKEGLTRCMNNEVFYLRLVGKGIKDPSFEKLADAVAAGDKKAGFEAAHALKGICANLSLTPLTKPVSEVTELFRSGADADYNKYLEEILSLRAKLAALCE